MYEIVISRRACKEFKNIVRAGLRDKLEQLFVTLRKDPYKQTNSFKKLEGELSGKYSRRINIKHRLIYQIDERNKTVQILSMWTHYEKH
jgi:Txe/YoeB family toxin of toxin-antitoxin system